jgi:hypothetical protein
MNDLSYKIKLMTSIEWLIEQLMERGFQEKNYEILNQAKLLHKQEIIDAHDMGYIMGGNHKKVTAEMYYAETYVSKGSDECQFESTPNISSATICANCGREKFLHKL